MHSIRPHLKETMQVIPFKHHLLVLMIAGLKATVKSFETVETFIEASNL